MAYWVEFEKQAGIRENAGTLTEARGYAVRTISSKKYGRFAKIYDSPIAKKVCGIVVKEDGRYYSYQYNRKGLATVYPVKRTGELIR